MYCKCKENQLWWFTPCLLSSAVKSWEGQPSSLETQPWERKRQRGRDEWDAEYDRGKVSFNMPLLSALSYSACTYVASYYMEIRLLWDAPLHRMFFSNLWIVCSAVSPSFWSLQIVLVADYVEFVPTAHSVELSSLLIGSLSYPQTQPPSCRQSQTPLVTVLLPSQNHNLGHTANSTVYSVFQWINVVNITYMHDSANLFNVL